MWPPLNEHVLPTKEEIHDIKIIIEELEITLEAARKLPEGQAAIDELEREINHRRAWIASVRRAPHDVLSIVFLEATRQDWKAPLVLGAVCRVWRRSTLDTRYIWSLMPLHHIASDEAIGVILERGDPYPLIIDAKAYPQTLSRVLAVHQVQAVTNRIRCLKMGYTDFNFLGSSLLNLTKLSVLSVQQPKVENAAILLDGSRFPNLRFLAIGPLLEGAEEPTSLSSKTLPPIEELTVAIRSPGLAAVYFQLLAPRLTVLWVMFIQPYDRDGSRAKIAFPRLRTLTAACSPRIAMPPHWPFDASTPVLLSYRQYPGHPGGSLHTDTKTVRQLAFINSINLAHFPSLRSVKTNSEGARILLRWLEADPLRLPDLQSLHCKKEGGIEKRINSFNLTSGRNIDAHLSEQTVPIITPPHTEWVEYAPYDS